MAFNNDAEYLQQVIIPYYRGYLDKEICVIVLNAEGDYLITSNLAARILGYASWTEMPPLNVRELGCKVEDEHKQYTFVRIEMCRKLGVPLDFLSCWQGMFYHTIFSPIYYPDGRFLGVELISEIIKLDWYMDVFVRLHGHHSIAEIISDCKIINSLSDLQKEVLFLLIVGRSQYEIGAFLARSRNTVKDIVDSLYKKFQVANLHELITHAIKQGFHRAIPASMSKDNSILTHIYSPDITEMLKQENHK